MFMNVFAQSRVSCLGQVRVGAGRCDGVRIRICDLKVYEEPFDNFGSVDERGDTRLAAAVDTSQRIDRLRLVNEPCPGGS
jgi:hypothetical protein